MLTRIVVVKNIPAGTVPRDIVRLFNLNKELRQIRLGNSSMTAGTCYLVYTSTSAASYVADRMNGYLYRDKYLIVSVLRTSMLKKRKAAGGAPRQRRLLDRIEERV